MLELWVVTGLVAVVGITITAVGQKQALVVADELTVVSYMHFVAIPLLVVGHEVMTGGYSIPGGVLWWLGASVACNIGSFYLFAAALSRDELSVAFALKNTNPLIVALVEPLVVVSTSYEPVIVAAAGLTVVGVFTLLATDSVVSPLVRLRDAGPKLALGSAVFISGAILIDRSALTQFSVAPTLYALLLGSGVTVVFGSTMLFKSGVSLPTGAWRGVAVAGVGRATSLLAGVTTLSLVSGGVFTVLQQLSLVGVVVIGVHQFGEENFKRRLVGVLCIFAAVALTAL